MPVIPHLRHDANYLSDQTSGCFSAVLGMNLGLYGKENPDHDVVEDYIYRSFKKKYSANVKYSFPYVLTLNYKKRICAAAGIRLAESGPLFLERYLQYPVEQETGMCFKTAVRRESIVELSNIISVWRGNNKLLLMLLIDLLHKVNREWLLLLSNREVEDALKKINFTTIRLSDISAKILNGEKEQWGSYFNDNSRIILCHVPSTLIILRQKALMKFPLTLFSSQLVEIAEQWKQKSE